MSESSNMQGGAAGEAGVEGGVKRRPFPVNWRVVLTLVILTAAISGSVIVTDLVARRDRRGAPATTGAAAAPATRGGP